MHRTDSNVAAPAAARASARRDALAARALGAARAANRRIREFPRRPALDSRAMSPVSPLERTDGARAPSQAARAERSRSSTAMDQPFIPQAQPYNPAHDDDIPTAQPAEPHAHHPSHARSAPPSAPPASSAVPDYGAFAEEQRAAWNENRRGWPTHDDEQQPPRRKRRRHPRGSRGSRGHDNSSPPVYQEGRPRSLCGCVFRLVRGAVKLPFFLATTAVCLPASAVGAVMLAVSAPDTSHGLPR